MHKVVGRVPADAHVQLEVQCEECQDVLGAHYGLRRGSQVVYGGFRVAPRMMSIGKRRWGPPKASGHHHARTLEPLPVSKPGPITVTCMSCGTERVINVGPGTVVW